MFKIGEKLYYVYYRSNSSRDRDMEPELDGVIWLTKKEYRLIHDWGYALDTEDVAEFEIHPVKPYNFVDAEDWLKPIGVI